MRFRRGKQGVKGISVVLPGKKYGKDYAISGDLCNIDTVRMNDGSPVPSEWEEFRFERRQRPGY
jgi:hypothetical protein